MKILFFFFSLLAIISLILIVYNSKEVYSILFLILFFMNISCLLLILKVEFISALIILIYISAITIFFLFIVMTTNLKIDNKTTIKLNIINFLSLISIILIILIINFDFIFNLFSQNLNYRISTLYKNFIFNYDYYFPKYYLELTNNITTDIVLKFDDSIYYNKKTHKDLFNLIINSKNNQYHEYYYSSLVFYSACSEMLLPIYDINNIIDQHILYHEYYYPSFIFYDACSRIFLLTPNINNNLIDQHILYYEYYYPSSVFYSACQNIISTFDPDSYINNKNSKDLFDLIMNSKNSPYYGLYENVNISNIKNNNHIINPFDTIQSHLQINNSQDNNLLKEIISNNNKLLETYYNNTKINHHFNNLKNETSLKLPNIIPIYSNLEFHSIFYNYFIIEILSVGFILLVTLIGVVVLTTKRGSKTATNSSINRKNFSNLSFVFKLI